MNRKGGEVNNMKKKLLLALVPFLISSCTFLIPIRNSQTSSGNTSTTSNVLTSEEQTTSNGTSKTSSSGSNSSSSKTSSSSSSTSSGKTSSNSSSKTSSDSGETRVENVYFSKKYLDLIVNKYEYLVVNFGPSDIEFTDEEKDGTFASSDTSVATVSTYGKVEAKKVGSSVITYTTKLGGLKAALTVYIHTSSDTIVREYQKVTDVNTIEVGDELILGCPEFGIAASLNEYNGYVLPSSASFSSDYSKINSWDSDVAEYYVGPSKDGNAFTLETQDNKYLAGRETQRQTKLSYSSNGKAQINWIIERPEGYQEDFIVSYDIEEDYWLMFNKINNSDIRFNLYDSNNTTLMKKPTIYRKTIVR